MVNWELVTTSKYMGGLDIQKVRQKNATSLTALAWRYIKNTQSLWARILTSQFSEQNDNNLKRFKVASRTQKNIIKGLYVCLKAAMWIIHKGDKVHFWTDKWLPNTQPLNIVIHGLMPNNMSNLNISDLWANGSWNFSSLPFELSMSLI